MYEIIAKPLYGLIIIFIQTQLQRIISKIKEGIDICTYFISTRLDIFHVHVNASTFAIRCILALPGEDNMDFLVCYQA